MSLPPKLYAKVLAQRKIAMTKPIWTEEDIERMLYLIPKYGKQYACYYPQFHGKFTIHDIKQMYKKLTKNPQN